MAARPTATDVTAPLRVLHVLGALERGGVETWLLNLLEQLDRRWWRFDFCALGPATGRYAAVAQARGSSVIACPVGAGRGPIALAGFGQRLYRVLKDGSYDIVHSHVHGFSALVLAVAKAAGIAGRVAHSHNTSDGAASTWARHVYRTIAGSVIRQCATLNLGCSADAADALFGGRAKIVHYGLNGDLHGMPFDPALRNRLGLPNGAAVIGHVGRFERQKNHGFLLDVATVLARRRPDLRWLLAGDGPLRPELEQRVRDAGLADHFVFCGRREDVDALLASAVDVFVLPSLHEGLPLALLEAQAAGLRSVVSTRVTTEAAAVEDAVEFLPLEAGPELWAERLITTLSRGRLNAPAARAELRSRGFAIDQSLTDLLGAYRSALARRGSC